MSSFKYTAIDSAGSEKSGALDAPDLPQAAALLRQRGLFPTGLVPAGSASSASKSRTSHSVLSIPFRRPISAKELSVFTRQLGTLLRAGMPLLRGLEVLTRQERKPAHDKPVNSA